VCFFSFSFGCVGLRVSGRTSVSLIGVEEEEDLESWAGVEEDACFWLVCWIQFSACTEHQADLCSPALERRVETQLPLRRQTETAERETTGGLRIFRYLILVFPASSILFCVVVKHTPLLYTLNQTCKWVFSAVLVCSMCEY